MDGAGSEERGRCRQADEGSGEAMRKIAACPVPSPQPLSRRERGFSHASLRDFWGVNPAPSLLKLGGRRAAPVFRGT